MTALTDTALREEEGDHGQVKDRGFTAFVIILRPMTSHRFNNMSREHALGMTHSGDPIGNGQNRSFFPQFNKPRFS
jgi:hypothetical protein